MGYQYQTSIAGARGRFGIDLGVPPINFSQIFSGTPLYYPGSTVEVQEVVKVITSVYDISLVDVDMNWWQPHEYRGTWQLTDGISASGRNEDQGYIWHPTLEVSRYSSYTITANPNTNIGLDGGGVILDCNAYIVPELYLFPNTSTPVPGFRFREIPPDKPLFRTYNSIKPAPLADTRFFRKINDVGIVLKPGIEGVYAEYRIEIINDIFTDYEPFPVSKCELVKPTCTEQFAAFVQGTLGGFKDGAPLYSLSEGTYYYSSLEAATRDDSYAVQPPYRWVCPTDPTTVITYYSSNV